MRKLADLVLFTICVGPTLCLVLLRIVARCAVDSWVASAQITDALEYWWKP